MNKLVLGNIDYRSHMTDEGDQLQMGLVNAGWDIAGTGYGDGCNDVQKLLDRYDPHIVFIQDRRDLDPECGAFRDDLQFSNMKVLANRQDIFKVSVVKDAGTKQEYQLDAMQRLNVNAIVNYYHPINVLAHFPQLSKWPLIRTYHSINADLCASIPWPKERKRCIVTGARSQRVYPLREMAYRFYDRIDTDIATHPDYHNRGSCVEEYLGVLSRYKVHIATASAYGFALRKIIESVAMGCTPVTNLPAHDVLPYIDDALVRVPTEARDKELRRAVDKAHAHWDREERRHWASLARQYYDYNAAGFNLNDDIMGAYSEYLAVS